MFLLKCSQNIEIHFDIYFQKKTEEEEEEEGKAQLLICILARVTFNIVAIKLRVFEKNLIPTNFTKVNLD